MTTTSTFLRRPPARNFTFVPARQQCGAALVVGLILLLAMSLLSLSSLKNTTRQQLMTTNTELELQAFAGAENALRAALKVLRLEGAESPATTYLEQAMAHESGTIVARFQSGKLRSQAVLTYEGVATMGGSSLNLGRSQGFVQRRFRLDSYSVIGTAENPLSRSWHRQRFAVLTQP